MNFYVSRNSNLFPLRPCPTLTFSRPFIMDSNAQDARDPQANEVFDDREDTATPDPSGSSPESSSVEDRPTAWVFPHTTVRDRGQLPIPDDGPTRAYIWAPKNMHRDRGAMVRMILRRQLFRTFTAVSEVDHNMFTDRRRLRDIIKSNPGVQMIEMSTERSRLRREMMESLDNLRHLLNRMNLEDWDPEETLEYDLQDDTEPDDDPNRESHNNGGAGSVVEAPQTQ